MSKVTIAALALIIACAPPPSPDDQAPLVLRGVTVIDGTGADPSPDMDVVIEGERIAAIRPSGESSGSPHARIVDLRGRYLLPGFIDTHAHVTVLRFRPDGDSRGQFDRDLSERALRVLLAHGITTVRNPSAPAADGVALRDAVARRDIRGPRILTSGEHLNDARKTEDETRVEVRRQVALGVDMIKVYGSLPPELVRAAIDEAHRQGVPVVGHLQRTTWTEAVGLGIDAITHGAPWSPEYLPAERRDDYRPSLLGRLDWLEWIDLDGASVREMIAALVESRTPVDPTLIAYHTKFFGNDPRYLDHPERALFPELADDWRGGNHTDAWTPNDYARAQELWPRVEELIRRYHEAGVLLSTGSDTPVPWVIPGVSLHEEFELLVAAGIPRMDVLTMATRNGAEALGLLKDIGTVEVGKKADLVVLSADPLQDIRHTREIELVLQGGELLRPAEILRARSSTSISESFDWEAAERLPWGETDYGVGVVGFRPPNRGESRTDTLRVLAEPLASADAVALLILDERDPGLPMLQFLSAPGLRWNGAEYAYEEAGLPFDSTSGSWVRVIYGRSSDGSWNRGWVDVGRGPAQAMTWTDVLQEFKVFHPDVSSLRFFQDASDNAPAEIDAGEDSDLVPIETDGPWMKVRIVDPSPCTGSGTPAREAVAWIRYLDEHGSPLVFPRTRGC